MRVKNKTPKEVDFTEALYRAQCGECGDVLPWEADFDADGTTYGTKCCDFSYWMSPSKVTVSRDPVED